MNPRNRREKSAGYGKATARAIRSAAPEPARFRPARFPFVCLLAFLPCASAIASAQTVSARQLVRDVVYNEIHANRNNHSHWIYLDRDRTPEKATLKLVVETARGTISKTLRLNGKPLTQEEERKDREKMKSVVHDPSVRAKQREDSEHDSKQAIDLMKMLPDAFLWSVTSESSGEATLVFKPDPNFDAPSYASRVFAAMAGTMVVDTRQKRLKDLSGTLIHPVKFAWGLFGKIEQGGTFQIKRTEVAPGDWEITQTHVHIDGHMLFFKSIGQQEDETTGHYMRSPAGLSLEKAMRMLTDGTVAGMIGVKPNG